MSPLGEGQGGAQHYHVRGARGVCGHHHAYLIAAATCMVKRRDRMERAGMVAWGVCIVGPGGRPLTVQENRLIERWQHRKEKADEEGDEHKLPTGVGLMRRLRLLMQEGMTATAMAALEGAASLLEENAGATPPLDAKRAAVMIRHAAGTLTREAMQAAAIRVERQPLGARPRRQAKREEGRRTRWETG